MMGRQWSAAGFEVDIISGGWGCGGDTTVANDPVGDDLRGFDDEHIVSEHEMRGKWKARLVRVAATRELGEMVVR
jgi:hypothetical protein